MKFFIRKILFLNTFYLDNEILLFILNLFELESMQFIFAKKWKRIFFSLINLYNRNILIIETISYISYYKKGVYLFI